MKQLSYWVIPGLNRLAIPVKPTHQIFDVHNGTIMFSGSESEVTMEYNRFYKSVHYSIQPVSQLKVLTP